jgi:hypothetical protein
VRQRDVTVEADVGHKPRNIGGPGAGKGTGTGCDFPPNSQSYHQQTALWICLGLLIRRAAG